MTKSEGLAKFLSFIVPGLGQAYNRHFVKAILFFLVPFTLWNIAYIYFPSQVLFGRGLFHEYRLATIVAFLIRIWSAIEAGRSAENINSDNDGGDFSIGKIKSMGINGFLNIKTVLVVLFLVFMVWGFTSTASSDYHNYGYQAQGTIVAQNSSLEMVDYQEAQDSHFIATSEDSQYYYGHWGGGEDASFSYEEKFQVNLSDIKWNVTVYDQNNPNINESAIKADLKKNISTVIVEAEDEDSKYDYSSDRKYDFHDEMMGGKYEIDGDIFTYYDKWSSSEVESYNGDQNFTIRITIESDSDFTTDSDITITFIIPNKNIHIEDPGIKTEHGKNYNVEKTY